MLIQYCSDLHLEFPINKKFLQENPIKPKGEILLLAGDIMLFADLHEEKEFIDFLSDHFQHTYWIPGNHEYYRSDVAARTGTFRENIRTNVSLVNNSTLYHKGVRLIFSTLWSNIDITRESVIKKSMADFHLIKNHGRKLSVENYNTLHAECLAFVSNELKLQHDQETIVVSHHLPTFMNYPEKYRHSELNTAFATELFSTIEQSDITYWIYGHTHEVVPDFTISKTILTSNQLGYVQHGEHHSFDNAKCIKV